MQGNLRVLAGEYVPQSCDYLITHHMLPSLPINNKKKKQLSIKAT